MTQKRESQTQKAVVRIPENLCEALAMAQGELVDAVADMENTHFRSKYVSLGALLKSVRKVLSRHGLSLHTEVSPAYMDCVEEETSERDGIVTKVTRNKRERDGHYITAVLAYGTDSRDSVVHCPKQTGVHQFASFHTYARRWLVQGLCGVSVDTDDDGNEASGVSEAVSGNDRLSHATTHRR
jgi:hypothetical protein